jgi:hypothetical protein
VTPFLLEACHRLRRRYQHVACVLRSRIDLGGAALGGRLPQATGADDEQMLFQRRIGLPLKMNATHGAPNVGPPIFTSR